MQFIDNRRFHSKIPVSKRLSLQFDLLYSPSFSFVYETFSSHAGVATHRHPVLYACANIRRAVYATRSMHPSFAVHYYVAMDCIFNMIAVAEGVSVAVWCSTHVGQTVPARSFPAGGCAGGGRAGRQADWLAKKL